MEANFGQLSTLDINTLNQLLLLSSQQQTRSTSQIDVVGNEHTDGDHEGEELPTHGMRADEEDHYAFDTEQFIEEVWLFVEHDAVIV